MKNSKSLKTTIVIGSLISLAVIWRIINNRLMIAPNLEIITAASALAAVILRSKIAIVVPILSMIISDLIIGNSSIFIFTWSAFALIGVASLFMTRFNKQPLKQVGYSFGFAIASSFTFFVVTNLGVWLQGWYPATLAGLIDCFLLAIPFYKTMLIGNLIIVPSAMVVWQLVNNRQSVSSLVINTFVSK